MKKKIIIIAILIPVCMLISAMITGILKKDNMLDDLEYTIVEKQLKPSRTKAAIDVFLNNKINDDELEALSEFLSKKYKKYDNFFAFYYIKDKKERAWASTERTSLTDDEVKINIFEITERDNGIKE